MLQRYKTIAQMGEQEYVIEKSIFIGYAKPIATEQEALAFIADIKKKHRDATHNVFAYMIGQQHNLQRFSDDGEPQGTAGLPMVEVLKKQDLHDVCLVVTRYFGGIKLGAGGLARAYTKAAVLALEASGIVENILHQLVEVVIDYTLLGTVQNQLRQGNFVIKQIDYHEAVSLWIYVKDQDVQQFSERMTDWCNGRCKITLQGEAYLQQGI